MLNLFKEAMITGIGAIFFTKDRLEEMVDGWVKEGKVSRQEASKLVDDMLAKAKKQKEELKERIEIEVDNSLNKAGFAKKDTIDNIKQQVTGLELEIKSLQREIKELKGEEGTEAIDDSN